MKVTRLLLTILVLTGIPMRAEAGHPEKTEVAKSEKTGLLELWKESSENQKELVALWKGLTSHSSEARRYLEVIPQKTPDEQLMYLLERADFDPFFRLIKNPTSEETHMFAQYNSTVPRLESHVPSTASDGRLIGYDIRTINPLLGVQYRSLKYLTKKAFNLRQNWNAYRTAPSSENHEVLVRDCGESAVLEVERLHRQKALERAKCPPQPN